MRHLAILLLLVSVIILSCGNNDSNLREYYFPYRTFTRPTTYVYKNLNYSADTSKREMHIEVAGNDTFLITKIFYGQGQHLQYIKEKITSTGSFIVNYILYDYTGTDTIKTPIAIKENEYFKWSIEKNKSYVWSVNFRDWPDSIYYSKKRYFTGEERKITFNNKQHECIVLRDTSERVSKNLYRNVEEKHFDFTENYFAKDLGLLAYKIRSTWDTNRIDDYMLIDINTK